MMKDHQAEGQAGRRFAGILDDIMPPGALKPIAWL